MKNIKEFTKKNWKIIVKNSTLQARSPEAPAWAPELNTFQTCPFITAPQPWQTHLCLRSFLHFHHNKDEHCATPVVFVLLVLAFSPARAVLFPAVLWCPSIPFPSVLLILLPTRLLLLLSLSLPSSLFPSLFLFSLSPSLWVFTVPPQLSDPHSIHPAKNQLRQAEAYGEILGKEGGGCVDWEFIVDLRW